MHSDFPLALFAGFALPTEGSDVGCVGDSPHSLPPKALPLELLKITRPLSQLGRVSFRLLLSPAPGRSTEASSPFVACIFFLLPLPLLFPLSLSPLLSAPRTGTMASRATALGSPSWARCPKDLTRAPRRCPTPRRPTSSRPTFRPPTSRSPTTRARTPTPTSTTPTP